MIKLYNTLTKQKEGFKPIIPNQVGIYSCGPTVYNYVHIGNLRSYLFADVLKRVFLYNNYKAKHVMNITDIDDKTIKGSIGTGISLKEFTEKYEKAFFEDLKKLNILPANIYPKATENIEGMVNLIKKLLEGGYAYKAGDGSVYYDISKFEDYGKLSGVDFERDLKSRISQDEYAKDEAHDFALWKAWDEKDGNVFWNTELGKGRPGWHVECSVMASKNLGDNFDIHTGGIDLVFPHHENEIAQSEAVSGERFVNYWAHNEMLMVDGQKMSKSLNNVYTLSDIIAKDFNPIAFRYLYLNAHYRQKLNFTWEALEGAKSAYQKLLSIIKDYQAPKIGCAELENKFLKSINNDLNTPQALAVLWEVVKSDYPSSAKAETLLKFDRVLGLNLEKYLGRKEKIPQRIIDLVEERQQYKNQKDYSKADEIRDKIEREEYAIEDLPGGKYKIIKK